MDLEFTINNQTLKRTDTTHPVDLSNEYLKCQFDFLSDDWEDLGKFAIFRTGDKNYRVAISENECYVPYDVLKHSKFLLTVYGVHENIRITTNYLWVHLKSSAFTTEYDESGEFNPDMTEEIWLKINELDNRIQRLENSIILKGTSRIIQTDESVELYAYCKADGMPCINKKIYFYEIMED